MMGTTAEFTARAQQAGWAFAAGGMDWTMHQALDAFAIAEGAESDFDYWFTQPDEGHFWEGTARARQYGYWLS